MLPNSAITHQKTRFHTSILNFFYLFSSIFEFFFLIFLHVQLFVGGHCKTSSGGALLKKSQKWGGTKKVPPTAPPRVGNPARATYTIFYVEGSKGIILVAK